VPVVIVDYCAHIFTIKTMIASVRMMAVITLFRKWRYYCKYNPTILVSRLSAGDIKKHRPSGCSMAIRVVCLGAAGVAV
jgi:hypothetical protein